MSGEYWTRLEQIARENELKKKAEERQMLDAEDKRIRQQQAIALEEQARGQVEEEARVAGRERTIARLTPILEDIRLHSQEIRKAPQNNITRGFSRQKYIEDWWEQDEAEKRRYGKIVLQWGEKLRPTPSELAVINSKRKPLLFPSVIVAKDFAHIDVEISEDFITIHGDPYYDDRASIRISQFFMDAYAILPLMAVVLRHPNHEIYRYDFDNGWYLHYIDNNGHPIPPYNSPNTTGS
jgi:hypothetical protein